MKGIFPMNKNHYTIRHICQFSRRLLKIIYHGSESISNLGPKILDLLQSSLKENDSLEVFKQVVSKWKPENCPCRLCKVYVLNVVFLENLT